MNQLNTSGLYKVSPAIQTKLSRIFAAGCCDDAQTQKVISQMWQ